MRKQIILREEDLTMDEFMEQSRHNFSTLQTSWRGERLYTEVKVKGKKYELVEDRIRYYRHIK